MKIEELIKEKCPNGVKWERLRDICEYVDYRGKTPNKSEQGIFLVTAKNIRKGYIDYEKSKEYITTDDYEIVMRRGLPKIGDVLITTEAPCGNVAQVDREDIALAQRVIKYRPKDKRLNSSFLKYILLGKSFQKQLASHSTGGTVKGIKGSILHTLIIPVPPIEIQNEIVNILDKFVELETKLETELQIRKAQYEYYSDKLFSNMNCEFKKLDDCLDLITYGFTSPMPDTNEGPWKITAKDIKDGKINFDTARHTDKEAYDKLTLKCKPFIGDVLLTKDGTLGRTAVVKTDNLCINQSVALLRVKRDLILPEYLNCLLSSPTFQSKMMADVGQGTIKHIYITKVNQMAIPVPSIEKQKIIIGLLSKIQTFVTDINEGLPAEIKMRHMQYEYYRDKLLSFN